MILYFEKHKADLTPQKKDTTTLMVWAEAVQVYNEEEGKKKRTFDRSDFSFAVFCFRRPKKWKLYIKKNQSQQF